MKTAVLLTSILLLLGACGSTSQRQSGSRDVNGLAALKLASENFRDGGQIPVNSTCDGANTPPVITWSDPPRSTRSFVLAVVDPDAPGGAFRHWAVFDVPALIRSIGGGRSIGVDGTNEFGNLGYGGPCPPPGSGVHHYHFIILALDVHHLGLRGGAEARTIEIRSRQHAVAAGEIVGTYERR